MTVKRRLFSHSTAYVLGTVLERAVGFLLVPFYARALSAEQLGTVSVARVITELLVVTLSLGLQSGAGRLYFDYRDSPRVLERFWGTLFTALTGICVTGVVLLLLLGRGLFASLAPDVAFVPFIVLAIIAAGFTPTTNVYLRTLQSRMETKRYIVLNVARALTSTVLIIALVVGWRLGAEGVLLGAAISAAIFWAVSWFLLHRDIILTFEPRHFKTALDFSIPVLPSTLANALRGTLDRLFLNAFSDAAAVGTYHVGATLARSVAFLANGVNGAFSPIFRDAFSRQDADKLAQLRDASLVVVALYSCLAAGLGLAAAPVVRLVAGQSYDSAAPILALGAFAFAAKGIYFVFSAVITYHRETLRVGMVISVLGAALNIVLNLLAIPHFGMLGAALAMLATEVLVTFAAALVCVRKGDVAWPYGRFLAVYLVAAAVAAAGYGFIEPNAAGFAFSLLAFAITVVLTSTVAWGSPLLLLRKLQALRKSG